MPKASGSSKSEKEVPVELGFLEEEDCKWKLKSAFFPSKFGGLPAWLNLKDVPGYSELKCRSCDKPMKFLLQVYAPQDSENAFHRTIFVFVCPNKACCMEKNSNKNLAAFRCQLSQQNEFYSDEAPNESDSALGKLNPCTFGLTLCKVCNARSTESCSSCRKVHYCSKDHQKVHWQKHKEECKESAEIDSDPSEEYAYNEQLIVIDTEVIPKSSKGKSDKDKMEEFQKLVSTGKGGTLEDSAITKEMLEAASYKSDKAFNKFKKRVAYHPDQILRYDLKGKPLWVSGEKCLNSSEVPPCNYCGGPRVFEFQIMPQLLNFMGDDTLVGDLDWGTLAVYTCEKNCGEGPAYKNEFIWQQDFKGDDKDDE